MAPKYRILLRAQAAGLALALTLGTSAAAQAAPQSAGQTAPPSEGQAAGTADRFTLKEAGREFISDTGRIWSSPARIKAKTVIPLVGLAAATAFLIASDESIRDGVQTFAGKHAWVGDVAPVVTKMGGLAGFATAGAFFGAGLVFKDTRARDTGYLAANAILQCFLVDTFLKGMTGRQRPSVAEGQDHWSGPAGFFKGFKKGQGDFYTSFASGHSAAAFSLATVIALQYRHRAWVPVLAYTVAAGVGLSRLTLDRHWASDVAIGALMGHLVARLVVRNHDRRRRVVPMLACTGRAVAFSVFVDLD
ncbi:MAG: phosphatase PAP2 family protein [Candidatus Aminicenantes bacterium RBG_16_66_30]